MRMPLKFLLALVLLFNASLSTSAQESAVAIINARVIDGNGGEPIEDSTVIIQSGSIRSIGRNLDIPENAEILDAAGHTVMPGLANMHYHLLGSPREGSDVLGYQRRLNAFLYGGVTTVLDLGNMLPFVAQMSQELDAGRLVGPKLYYAGPLIDGADPAWPNISVPMASMAQAPYIVSRLRSSGVSAIKVYGNLSATEVRAVTRAAKQYDIPVIADMFVRNGAEHFVDAGLRAFAHPPNQVTPETISTMKELDVHIITTFTGYEGKERARTLEYLSHPLIAHTVSPSVLNELIEQADQELSPEEQSRSDFRANLRKTLMQNIGVVHKAGIPLIAGTDGTTVGVFPGEGIHRELEFLVEAGLSPLEAITAATKNAAMLLQHEDEWGTIEAGKRADILIVNGRPDEDISETRNIVTVIQRGKIIDRAALQFKAISSPDFREVNF